MTATTIWRVLEDWVLADWVTLFVVYILLPVGTITMPVMLIEVDIAVANSAVVALVRTMSTDVAEVMSTDAAVASVSRDPVEGLVQTYVM